MEGFISLGLSLLEGQDCITPTPSISGEALLTDALQIILKQQIPRVAVIDHEGCFLGVVESLDILENFANQIYDSMSPVESLIKQPEHIVYEEDGLIQNIGHIMELGWSSTHVLNQKGQLKGELRLDNISKAIREMLRNLDYFISRILGAVHNAIVAIDSKGRVVFYNPSAEETLSFREKDIMGQPIKKFFPESLTYKALESEQEFRGIRMQFGERNTCTDFLPIEDQGKLLGAVAIFKDVTELEAVTYRLSTNEKLMATLDAVVENSYEGMVVIDDQERIILMNQFFLDVMELKSQDVIGKDICEISPESKLPETLKTGLAQFGETWHVGGRDFIIMRVPIERDGKVVGAIGKTLFKNMEIAKMFAKKVIRLEENLAYYKEELGKFHSSQFAFDDIIGESPIMKAAKSLAKRASRTASTVLILGESGTGKEVFSHAIHESSSRSKGPFIKINCAALPENLLESELFGYADGAFTGARKGGKPGKFELADKGTIFLDEIGDMSSTMQAKLLRVLQEREVERLGGTQPIKVDVRIIAATNRNLHQMVIEHKFRLDLYYRLNVLVIDLPPLRDRREDIDPIARALMQRINKRLGTLIQGFNSETLKILTAYHWPGNIRELENILERAMVTCDEHWIQPKHLSLQGDLNRYLEPAGKTLEVALAEAEREIIRRALRNTRGNKVHAAKILGIHRSLLYKKITKLNIIE